MRKILPYILASLLMVATAYAQITTAPLVAPRKQFLDAVGNPLAGGKVYFYLVGTTTPQNTYTDYTGVTPNDNPVILDAGGYASIYIDCTQPQFKIIAYDSADVLQWSEDGVQYPGNCTSQSCPTGEVVSGIGTDGTIVCSAVSGATPIADVLNTVSQRWSSLIYSCGTGGGPIDRADAVFDEWDDSAISARACPGQSFAAGYLFPLAKFLTTTSASSYHVISTYDTGGGSNWSLGANPQFSIRSSFSNRASGFRRWIAWTDQNITGMTAINDPFSSQVAGFYACDDSGGTCEGGAGDDTGANNVFCYVADGTNSTYLDSGTNFVVDQVYLYQVFYDTTTATATMKIDGATVCTMTTDAPLNTENVQFHSSITNVSGGVDYHMYVYGAYLFSDIE